MVCPFLRDNNLIHCNIPYHKFRAFSVNYKYSMIKPIQGDYNFEFVRNQLDLIS